MDFIKKNWSKIVLAVLAVLGAVVFLVAMIDKIGAKAEFPAVCFDIMGLVFFLGTAAYLIFKMLELKAVAKYIMIAVGIINLVLVCIFLFGNVSVIDLGPLGTFKVTGFDMVFGKKVPAVMQLYVGKTTVGGIAETATEIGFVIVATLFPLVKGIKKLCNCDKEDVARTASR